MSQVKPVGNISKNLQSFLEIRSVQTEVFSTFKVQDHAYEKLNPFGFKEDNASQGNRQNQLSHPGLSYIEQECQESLIQRKIHNQKIRRKAEIDSRKIRNQQNSNEGLKYW